MQSRETFYETRYHLIDNKLDRIELIPIADRPTYVMYKQNNDFIYVRAKRDRLSKYSILMDIEHIYKIKSCSHHKDNKLNEIEGFTINFFQELLKYDIKATDVKEVIENAKNYHSRKNIHPESEQRVDKLYQEYSYNYQPRLYH